MTVVDAMNRTSIAIALAALACMLSSTSAQAQHSKTWGNGRKWGSGANGVRMNRRPESELLLNKDNLVPTQNRTQAMRLEAETGRINPQVDSTLRPMLKKQSQLPHIAPGSTRKLSR